MSISKTDFIRAINKFPFSEYNRENIIGQINLLLDKYEDDNSERPFPELKIGLVNFCESKGLDITCFGKVINVRYHNVEVLMKMIECDRYDILYHLLDNHGYESVVDGYRNDGQYKGHISEDYYREICYYKRPLKMALDKNDHDLVIKLISYGAFSMSYKETVIEFLEKNNKFDLIYRIIEECEIDKELAFIFMHNKDLFIRYIDKHPDFLHEKIDYFGEGEMNLMIYAISLGYYDILDFLNKNGVPLTPTKINFFSRKKNEFLKLIENFDGYSEFVRENERD